jgi:DNA polymerase-3 subunit epsilon
MTLLFVDTETTGLPDFRRPHSWTGQPRICQFGAILTDLNGATKAELNLIIRPDGWTIPAKLTEIHGISQADAEKYGVRAKDALNLFTTLCGAAELVVAHNIEFDRFMIYREIAAQRVTGGQAADGRANDGQTDDDDPETFIKFNDFCTMNAAIPILKLPPTDRMKAAGRTGFKWPSLRETYRHFFGRDFDGTAHDAMADVRACRDIYFALKAIKSSGSAEPIL